MTIQYKNATFDLTTTNLTTTLSIATSAIAIVKTVQAVHDTASNVDVHLVLKKVGGSDVKIAYEELNKETQNMLKGTINLEGGDVLKLQAGTANEITGQISYLLVDRSQENG
jgi:hypothetical protein|tara:strand:+ start:155 stop:490 length:336 start_codon:yes stop_codon:yes gene_type:complete